MSKIMGSKKSVWAFILTLVLLITAFPIGVFATGAGYTVTVTNGKKTGGSYEVSKIDGVAVDEVVTITTSAVTSAGAKLSFFQIGYEEDGAYVVKEPVATATDLANGIEVFEFKMPASNVDVYMDFITEEDLHVHRLVYADIQHGSAVAKVLVEDTANTQKMLVTEGGKCNWNKKVEITIKPDAGYRLDTITVTPYDGATGQTIKPQRIANTTNAYIFIMPDHAAQMNITYVPGPNYELREKVYVSVDGNYATKEIRSADNKAYTKADTFDKVVFADKTWYVVDNNVAKHKMVLLADFTVGQVNAANINSKLSLESVGITNTVDQNALVAYSGVSASYVDEVTDALCNTVKKTYTNNTSFSNKPFLLTVEDIRKISEYEDQIKFGSAWWLGSTLSGQQAYVDANGNVRAGSDVSADVRPAVVIDTNNVVAAYVDGVDVANGYVRTETISGRQGAKWHLVMHDSAKDAKKDKFEYRSAYRVTDKTTVAPTNDMNIVVTGAGVANQLVIMRGGKVQYYEVGKTADDGKTFEYDGVLAKVGTSNPTFNKAADKLYVLQGENLYASKLYEIKLHEHSYAYTSELNSKTGDVKVQLTCETNDGTKCLFNEDEKPQAYMLLHDPDFSTTLMFDNTAKTITEDHGSTFMPIDFGYNQQVSVTYYNADDTLTTGDWFNGNNAASSGNAPKEDGEYYAIVSFPSTAIVPNSKDVKIEFEIGCDVYKIKAESSAYGKLEYSHNDSQAIADGHTVGGRPHAGAKVTVTVSATQYNGWVVDGLDVKSQDGKTVLKSFNADKYGVTGTAVDTYTFNMPAEHIILEPKFKEHTHLWAEEWSSDGSVHWHNCLAANCTSGAINATDTPSLAQRLAYHEHDFGDYEMINETYHKRVCKTCGYVEMLKHTFAGAYSTNEAIHWQYCGDCKVASQSAAHVHGNLIEGSGDYSGKHYYQCLTCNAIYDIQDHVYDLKVENIRYHKDNACCTSPAVYYYSCECGAKGTETFTTGSALPHDLGQWASDAAAHWKVCGTCNGKEEYASHTNIKKVDEKYVKTAPTCTSEGEYYESCSVCGLKLTSTFTVAALAHTPKNLEAKEEDLAAGPTCTHGSLYYQYCSDCGVKLTTTWDLETDKIAHTYVYEHNDTEHWQKCSVCNTTTASLTHVKQSNRVESTSRSAATCTCDAVYYYTCSECGLLLTDIQVFGVDTVEGSKLGHDYSEYFSTGKTGHNIRCTRCGDNYLPSGYCYKHDFVVTSETDLQHIAQCKVCGYTVGPEDHYANDVSGTLSTCEDHGSCAVCGHELQLDPSRHKVYGYTPIDGTSHKYEYSCTDKKGSGKTSGHTFAHQKYGDWYDLSMYRTIDGATCSNPAGTYYDFCVYCDYGRNDGENDVPTFSAVGLEGHNFVATNAGTLKSLATCESPAEYYCCCSICGHCPTDEEIGDLYIDTFQSGAALGHEYEFEKYDDSQHVVTCNRTGCGYNQKEDHSYTCTSTDLKYRKSAATCSTGNVFYLQCVCGATNASYTFNDNQTVSHNYEWKSDANNHWKECSYCHDKINNGAHESNDTPTCTTYKTCSVCGITFGALDSSKHSYTILVTNEAYHWHKCSECSTTDTAVAHTFSNTYTTDAAGHWYAATCTEKCNVTSGYDVHTGGAATCTKQAVCSECGVSYGVTLPHTVDMTEAHCSDASIHTYNCSVCGNVAQTETHTYYQKIEGANYLISAATCTQPAYYYLVCSCGATSAGYKWSTGEALKHNYQLVSASTTEAKYKCNRCNEVVTVTLSVDGGTEVSGVKQFVYNTGDHKHATVAAVYEHETDANFKTVTLPSISYSSDTTNAGDVIATAAGTGYNLTITYQIVRADQAYNLTTPNYTYEQDTMPVATVTNLEENPDVKFFYRKDASDSWKSWPIATTTDLTPGAYQMYATIAATRNYNATNTAVKSFTVTKASQTLEIKDITVPFETVGMRPVVKGARTALSYEVTGSVQDVIRIENPSTGIIKTIRGGEAEVTITAAETAFFFGATKKIKVEVTSRALAVSGISMVHKAPDNVVEYYYGQEVEYQGVPIAALREIEKAVPGWTYEYEGTNGTTYAKSTIAPVSAGSYNLYVTILDDNHQYVGQQVIPFRIAKIKPSLTNAIGTAITYMDEIGTSHVSGTATNPINGETAYGEWAFIEVNTVPHVADSNVTQYRVIFTPTGIYAENYSTAEGLGILTVNKRMPGETVLATCSSYTYGEANPTIEIGNYTGTYGDGTQPTNVTYYYSLNVPDNMTDGTVWTGQSDEVNAGNYYFWAVIGSSDYQTTATAITEFKVEKGTQPTPSFTMTDEKMTIAKADKDRALEYSVDGETWINVPKLDGSGSFVIAGLKKGEHTFKLRAAETQNYKASAVTNTSVTINKFSVAYHPNMGVGSIAPVFVNAATVAAASSTGISRTGYTFDKWNTNPDGSGTSYAAGAELSDNAILYAIWKANDYTVCFDGNGGTGSQAEQGFTYGTATNLNACGFTKEGKVFAGWSTAKDKAVIYADQELVMNVVPSGYVTLYAIWADTCKLSGRIYSCSNSSVNLTLMQGTKVYQSCTVTDLTKVGTYSEVPYEHEYSFDNIPAGLYNIIVKQLLDDSEEKIITEQLYVSGNDTKNITITSSRVKSLLEVKEGTRHVVVGGLAEEAEGKRAENKDVKVVMDVEAVVEAVLPASATNLEREIQRDIASIKRIAKTDNLEYFNADIFETIKRYADGAEKSNTTQIRDTHNIIEIVVPYDMTGIRSIQIYRAHNGQAIMMKEVRSSNAPADGTYWVEKDKGLIHIYATKFSVYAIGYNAPESVIYVVRDGGSSVATKPAVTGPAYTLCPKDETCPIEPFIDAINNEWYHDGVHFCIEERIMIGRTTELFVPEGSLLRAEIVAMLWRRAGSPIVDYELTYQDIDASDYYGEALRWATKIGVIDGYDSLHFGPRDNVTREQLAAMLYRYAQLVENDKHEGAWASELTFLDTNKIDDYAVDAIHWCFENKVIEGKPGNIFDPYGDATRAEAACMVQRFCNRNLDTAVAE